MPASDSDFSRRTLLKGLAAGAVSSAFFPGFLEVSAMSRKSRPGELPAASPESLGISSDAILAFIKGTEERFGGLHSFVLVRHGKVAAQGGWAPYTPQTPHMLFSLSKSFTSTAIGLAVSEGSLKVEDRVLSFFPEDAPKDPGKNLTAMSIRDLLTMTSGHDKDTLGALFEQKDGNWVKGFLSLPVEHEPGTHFVYNSGATYMLSAILQKATGKTLLDYLKPRLFTPLKFENPTWETCPKGINTGGWGLSINTEEIARFGQLYLQKGMWEDDRLIPADWVKAATSKQVSNGDGGDSDWAQGYGYQFWQCRHASYRGDGAFGQFCVVMPEQDAVLAITSGVGDMQGVLNLAWEHLLPAMQEGKAPGGDGADQLGRTLEKLNLKPQEGTVTSPMEDEVSGKTYRFEPNEWKIETISLKFEGDRCRVTMKYEQGTQRLECGHGQWLKGKSALDGPEPQKVAVSGAWTNGNTYVVQACYYETPFIRTITCRFEGDEITLSGKQNVGFGPTERPTLKGRLRSA